VIGASSHRAKKAGSGIGPAKMVMHRRGEGIQRKAGVLHLRIHCEWLLGSAHGTGRVLAANAVTAGSQVGLVPDACSFGGDPFVFPFGNRTHQHSAVSVPGDVEAQ
jgi:hypothetical protein